jgi:hypothetical protein
MKGEIEIREAFEKWYSDGCEWPKAVEKDGRGEYLYAGASTAWAVWKAASERYEGMEKALRVIHTWASLGVLDAEKVLELTRRELGVRGEAMPYYTAQPVAQAKWLQQPQEGQGEAGTASCLSDFKGTEPR